MVYDINLKKVKSGRLFGIIFLVFGILFLVIFGAAIFSQIIKKNSLDSEVQSHSIEWEKIVDEDEGGITYSPTYYYKVNNIEYSCESTTSSNIKSGKGIVYYDSKNPANCMTDFEKTLDIFLLVFLLIPIIFIIIGYCQIKSYFKKLKMVKSLGNNGVLVKCVPYKLVDSNVSVNDVVLKCFQVTYTFPNGITKELFGEPVYDHILEDFDGRCDLLYDPNNYDNYFIDLEITATGHGTPTIIQYNQSEQGANNLSYANMNKSFNNESNSYNLENKF